jgi:hypothetical protein
MGDYSPIVANNQWQIIRAVYTQDNKILVNFGRRLKLAMVRQFRGREKWSESGYSRRIYAWCIPVCA